MDGHDHGGHRARMRERFARGGLESFAPHEVLELLLMYAIPRRNVNPDAHRLLKHFGSVSAVFDATPEALRKVPGIGEAAATLLSLVRAAGRYAEHETQTENTLITNHMQAKEYCRHLFSGIAEEVLYVICLDARGRVIRAVDAIHGTIDEIPIYPRTIMEVAFRHSAHSVVLAHNHPSGVAEPSEADILTTDSLRVVLAGVDIALNDHIVYADGQCVSIKQWQQIQIIAPHFPAEKKQKKAADTGQGTKRGAQAMKEKSDDT